MTVLVAYVREAQPGRVAEVRRVLHEHAQAATEHDPNIRTFQVLQGRAQSNLYVDLVEWSSRKAFEQARDGLASAEERVEHLFLRPPRVRVYQPLEVLRVRRREPKAVGVGLIRTRAGSEDAYANTMRRWIQDHFRERAGLLAAGLYQSEDEPQQFLVRNAWDSEEDLMAHRSWLTHEILPSTDAFVARREILALLTRWHYRLTPLTSGTAV